MYTIHTNIICTATHKKMCAGMWPQSCMNVYETNSVNYKLNCPNCTMHGCAHTYVAYSLDVHSFYAYRHAQELRYTYSLNKYSFNMPN